MTKHPLRVEGFSGTLEELAHSIGNIRYDQTVSFLEELAHDLKRQADADAEKGRKKLAAELYETVTKLYDAKESLEKAWKICEPYMKEGKNT